MRYEQVKYDGVMGALATTATAARVQTARVPEVVVTVGRDIRSMRIKFEKARMMRIRTSCLDRAGAQFVSAQQPLQQKNRSQKQLQGSLSVFEGRPVHR